MEDPLPKLLAIVLIGLALATVPVSSKVEPTQDNYIIANAPHFYDHTNVLASVDCMEQRESSCDPTKINWGDWHQSLDGAWIQGSMGCMQYSPFTFSDYCIDKYGLTENPEDIFNCSISRECAVLMLNEGLGHHWSTYKYCN